MKSGYKEKELSGNADQSGSNISAGIKVVCMGIVELQDIMRDVVQNEISQMANRIINELKPSDHDLKEGVQYTTNQVATILGVTRNTIRNYRIEGILPEPAFNLSGRPVWSAEQIVSASRQKGIKTKFDL